MGWFGKKPLCKHNWEFVGNEQVVDSIGGVIDVYWLRVEQCSKCLKVQKKIVWLDEVNKY